MEKRQSPSRKEARRRGAGFELPGDVVIAHDGAGDELGEEADVEQVAAGAMGGLRGATIDIHEIADLLEGEEGNADGQDDGLPRERRQAEEIPARPRIAPRRNWRI
jgi:hypothetical protein